MKKQIQSIRFFLLTGLLAISFMVTANNNVACSESSNECEMQEAFNGTFTYSWSVEPGAVSYVVDMVNTATQESFSWETANTSLTVFSLPSGTYDLTVTAKFANQSSSIIIDDAVEH